MYGGAFCVCTVYGLPYRWGLREASLAYVLGDTSTYKEKKFLAEVVHKGRLGVTYRGRILLCRALLGVTSQMGGFIVK
jgi:hypothetical protein